MPKSPPRKTTAEVLKEALAAKKASAGVNAPRLRPAKGSSKPNKDAERLSGKSRKVH